ncbi:hypothetical protein DBV15_09663 [Temnothorax longispinosus]|uniref:Uncharacterized protein n=1 Tax=Temnothorax longispinosus TaxID=300112 RepID=A0A4S2L2U0_9HYME|nr:hypothetical protein DBV15_09663 [Temnothorax longispinosus]
MEGCHRTRKIVISSPSLSKVRRVPGLARATTHWRERLTYGERERDILAVKRYSDSKAGSHVAEAGVVYTRRSKGGEGEEENGMTLWCQWRRKVSVLRIYTRTGTKEPFLSYAFLPKAPTHLTRDTRTSRILARSISTAPGQFSERELGRPTCRISRHDRGKKI